MSLSGYEQQIVERVKHLPVDRQREVFDFVGYLLALAERESDEATQEILSDPEAMEDIRVSREQFARGEYVEWEDVRDTI